MRQSDNILFFPVGVDTKLRAILDAHYQGNNVEALRMCLSLIDEGHSEAYGFAGVFFEKGGIVIDPDLSKARFYYEKSVEECGAVEGYLGLARIYYYGLGVEKDYCKAWSLYARVVQESDSPVANLMLGRMYQDGLCVAQDYDRAASHYERSWDSGNVMGLTHLGLLEQKKDATSEVSC